MKRPEPKRELFVQGFPVSETLVIYANSADAVEWVTSEGPRFGTLFKLGRRWRLLVSKDYDFGEVLAWIESMGED